ncbi:MAG: hypothetical protein QXJ06_01670 [Candidatus Aenigmatarchaeota archaeon]
MVYPNEVLTKNKKGQTELRNLIARGSFVLYDYRDPESFEILENGKKKICLKTDDDIKEFFIIPLKTKDKYLVIEDVKNKGRKVWNEKTKKVENLF